MSKKIIVANWKMNPESVVKAKTLFDGVARVSKKYKSEVVVCAPFPFISILKNKNIFLGAQNLFAEKEGAFTGEVSSKMLASLGVSYVILGHSERRVMGETSLDVSKKIAFAIKENLKPILCIGEKERDSDGHFFNTIKQELSESLSSVSKKQIQKVVIAYEPVWAIGSASKGAMEPSLIHETVLFIKKVLSDKYGKESLKVKILYGGSVEGENAEKVISIGACDGLLVGRASLNVVSFEKILANIEMKKSIKS